jgi:hypothetical protein
MGKLQDILHNNGGSGDIRDLWNSTAAAGELVSLPPGEYTAHIIAGTLETGKTKGTPGYKLTFKVCEGEYIGRQFWLDIWLTEASLPMAKRDLKKLGVVSLDQLEQPLPRGILCKCKLVLRRGDDGGEFNKVRTFTVVGIDKPEADTYAPTDEPEAGTSPDAATDGTERESEGTDPGTADAEPAPF